MFVLVVVVVVVDMGADEAMSVDFSLSVPALVVNGRISNTECVSFSGLTFLFFVGIGDMSSFAGSATKKKPWNFEFQNTTFVRFLFQFTHSPP